MAEEAREQEGVFEWAGNVQVVFIAEEEAIVIGSCVEVCELESSVEVSHAFVYFVVLSY